MVDIKSTSNAVWWIKNPKQRHGSEAWGTQLCQDMTDLFRHISLHGYNKLVDTTLLSCERFIWLCLHVTIFGFMCVALTFTWDKFVLQHFSINLHDPLYPVENVAFPAVSICSNNRISRKAAEKYAHELSKLDPANQTVEHFITRISYFNSLYFQFDRANDYDSFGDFQKFLDHHVTADNETFYNVLNVMRKLTPACEDFIKACMLGAKTIDCFGEHTFESKLTMYGPCCMFNANNSYRNRSYRTRFAGPNMGLYVVLNTSHSDDTASLLNMDGYAVIIHASNKFPDIASGGILEVFPNVNEETLIAVNARVMDSDQELRTFAPSHRNCYFDDEAPDQHLLLNKKYSLQNCITRCRTRSVIALCNCIPFYTPLKLLDNIEGVPFCTLSNIECMQQYKFKWRNVLTQRVHIKGLERESEEALYCPQCMPSCIGVRYDISMMSLPADNFSLPEALASSQLGINNDISVLRVFFGKATVPVYKRVITNTWVEALIKWRNVLTERVDIMGLERESEEALYCPQCLPSCDEIRYRLSMMSFPADRSTLPAALDYTQFDFNNTHISTLRVFFGEASAQFYQRVITNSWTQALSTVGNIVSICMGFSLVALLEILYFLLKYLYIALRKFIKGNANQSKWNNDEIPNDKLYICP